jgi:hypothetical protein
MITPRIFLRTLLALFAVCCLSVAGHASTTGGPFAVKLSVSGDGAVYFYNYDDPEQQGAVYKSHTFQVQGGSVVMVIFHPEGGHRIANVTDNGADVTALVLESGTGSSPYYEFDVLEAHDVTVRYALDAPVGTFNLGYKEAGSATPIVDVTGTYSGIIPTKKKPYTLDAAMDESGKIIAVGTVEDFIPKGGSAGAAAVADAPIHATGSLKTVNNVPTASMNGSVEGTIDGDEIKGSGKAAIPVVLTPAPGGAEVEGIVASGSAKENGVAWKAKPTTVSIPAQNEDELAKDWSLVLTIADVTDAKGKTFTAASAILNLPNGEKTRFKEKKVKYSSKNGYSINFAGGVKLDELGNPILNPDGKSLTDRTSRIKLSKMILEKTGLEVWTPTSGVLSYKFLGQKGVGDLIEFLGEEPE